MLDWLKSAWARWRVQISVVGGVLVIATAYGTCTYEAPSGEVSATVNTNTAETVQVNSTTTDETTTTNSNENTGTNEEAANTNATTNSTENTTTNE